MIRMGWNQLSKNGREQKTGPLVNDVTGSKSSKQNIITPKSIQPVKRYAFQSARIVSLLPSYKFPLYQLIRDADLNLQLLASLLVGHEIKLFIFTKLGCHRIVSSVSWAANPCSITKVQIDQFALNLGNSRRNLALPKFTPSIFQPNRI